MGNAHQETSNDEYLLLPYLKPELTMDDLHNLKAAFDKLEKDQNGKVFYDVNKISSIDKYSLEIDSEQTPGNKILLNFDQFMKVMTNNIISTRKRLGHSNTQFESITSNVSCFICISNN